jgi:multiple sugar transport system substrate-binding protein
MADGGRRDALKTLGAAGMALGAATLFPLRAGAAADLRYKPEKGASLKVMRWKRFVQGDEDLWLANSRKFTELTGVPVTVESVAGEDVRSKAAMSANVGAGPDVVLGFADMPHLYPDKCLDVTELAEYLGQKYGGWYESSRRYGMSGGRWTSMTMAFVVFALVYRQNHVRAAGFTEAPRDLPGLLKLCKALKARGTPPGMALGNAVGDSGWCNWLLWSHGASLIDDRDRVVVNSKETIAALEYARELYSSFVPGTLSWIDPHNNKAFLSGEISLTYNPVSIYYAAKTSDDPALKALAAYIVHAPMPVGPVGRPMERGGALQIWGFRHSRYPNAAREYMRFLQEKEQYEPWQQASLGFMCQALRAYEANPVWTSDPKLTVFRDGPARSVYDGYPGSLGAASAAVAADFVIVNMIAEAASGRATPQEAARRAEARARRYYRG